MRSAVFIMLIAISTFSVSSHNRLDRGYLTTISELEYFARQARWDIEPYASLYQEFFSDLDDADDWDHGSAGGSYYSDDNRCYSNDTDEQDRFINQQGGAHAVFAKMIAYHLSHETEYAKTARAKILEVTTTYDFGGNVFDGSNECIRHIAFAIPLWIQAADLLEGEPIWTDADKRRFQQWLAEEVYYKVAWASRVERANWGSAGSVAASTIADYLIDRTDIMLIEVQPDRRELTPQQAYIEHNDMQLQRMNTKWRGDSRCDIYGIQPYGGIPDELRRGDTGCNGRYLDDDDDSYTYQITQIDHLVYHAELLRRRGDTRIYNNIEATGGGFLLNAILFLIDNPVNTDASVEWETYKTGILNVANSYYHDDRLQEAYYTNSVERGSLVAFGQITHPIVD